jgi:hypothetical protein
MKLGDLDKSLTDLGAAQDLTPDDPWVSRMLAWTYRVMGVWWTPRRSMGVR